MFQQAQTRKVCTVRRSGSSCIFEELAHKLTNLNGCGAVKYNLNEASNIQVSSNHWLALAVFSSGPRAVNHLEGQLRRGLDQTPPKISMIGRE